MARFEAQERVQFGGREFLLTLVINLAEIGRAWPKASRQQQEPCLHCPNLPVLRLMNTIHSPYCAYESAGGLDTSLAGSCSHLLEHSTISDGAETIAFDNASRKASHQSITWYVVVSRAK